MAAVLAIEGGGTRSCAGLYDATGVLIAEAAGGPCNPLSCGLDNAVRALQSLGETLLQGRDTSSGLCVLAGIVGLFNAEWRQTLAERLASAFAPCEARVTDDFRPLLLANAGHGAGVLVIAGTGSKIAARAADGRMAHAGGYGTPFGEEGSGYQVALSALRTAAAAMDHTGPETRLAEVLPEAVGARDFGELVTWANLASKRDIADLARAAAELAEQGDGVARMCFDDQARRLAGHTVSVWRQLKLSEDAPVFLVGGLFERCTLYRRAYDAALDAYTDLRTTLPALRGHRAVFELCTTPADTDWLASVRAEAADTRLPVTERHGAHKRTIDTLSAAEIVELMQTEDATVAAAVGRCASTIARAVEAAAAVIGRGGRMVYVGAGTSGRLGALDAAECPPTFGAAPDRVTALMAGGPRALSGSVEGAEDDREQGAADLGTLAVGAGDLVVGIAASGATPYVRAALDAAHQAGARTVLLCCNPDIREGADTVIALDTGPEVLTGSTRLKAGTATKMVLNMISTGAFALAGYVYGGYMVEMKPVNVKLRGRAARIISALGRVTPDEAAELLEQAGNRIAVAIVMARRNVDAAAAVRLLESAGARLDGVIGPPGRD